MPYISGYTVGEKIFGDLNKIVYRGIREKDGLPVLFKLPPVLSNDSRAFHCLKREYEKLCSINDDNIIKPVDFIQHNRVPILILEDSGLQFIGTVMDRSIPDIRSFLHIGAGIACALSKLHENNIIYNNIELCSVMINPESSKVKLVDFSMAFQHNDNSIPLKDRYQTGGNLSFISPEQTGRLNTPVDFRADLYSLGVLFYYMLCGKLPFCSKDPMEIIHSHIARKAKLLKDVNDAVPEVLSSIVEKLMEKKVEDRYQTAYGLESDLKRCLELLEYKNGACHINSFQIADNDALEEFKITGRFYNRNHELERLKEAFYRVKNGNAEMVFITGYPGIGKTSLSNNFLKYAGENGAICSWGKSDQYNKDIPYKSFTQAFRSIIRNILMENEEVIERWREKIVNALSPNGRIIVDMLPELEKIIGIQPGVPELSPIEAQNRFDDVLLKFVQALGTQESPLVLFIDDLQWASFSSIRLLESIARDKDLKHVMIVGAYRDNEIHPAHPLGILLRNMDNLERDIPVLSLKPLEISHVNKILEETLNIGPKQSNELAKVCMKKTKGTPFFLIQFLYSLREEKYLRFDREKRAWVWDIKSITNKDVTDNVVDLMVGKINKLPQSTIEILKYAACINNSFDIDTLSIASQKKPDEVRENLKAAVDAGLIYMDGGQYRFLHDRIQQAAYIILDDNTKMETHYRIGRLLYKDLQEQEREERIFEIADHFNLSGNCITNRGDTAFYSRYNVKAGKKAETASDFQRALEYYLHGINLLEEDCWEKEYQLALELHIEGAQAAYASTDFELMETLAEKALLKCREGLDKARVYEITIAGYTAQNKLEKALDTSFHALGLLGISIPKRPNLIHVMLEYMKTLLALRGKKTEELLSIPTMTDKRYITGMRIIVGIGMASYSASPYAFILFIFKAIYISLKHGTAEGTIVAFASYGCITTILFNRTSPGQQFFKLAFMLQDKMGIRKYNSTIKVLFNMTAWRFKPIEALKEFPDSYQSGIASGDLLSAGHSIMQYFVYSYFLGRELPAIVNEMDKHYNALLKTGHDTSIRLCEIYLETVLNFKGDTKDPCSMSGEHFNEEKMLSQYIESNDRTVVFSVYLHKLIQYYYFGRFREARECLAHAEKYMDGVLGTICVPLIHFYRVLILASKYEGMKGLEKLHSRVKINNSIRLMEKLASSVPDMTLNKLYLMKAEKARIDKKYQKAGEYYDKSIELAGKNGLIQEEAIANELAGRFYISCGREKVSRIYINSAYSCYQRWGAGAKTEDLNKVYSKLLETAPYLKYGIYKKTEDGELPSTLSHIDLNTIIRLGHIISQEIVLEDLLELLVKHMLQYSGARKVVFIMNYENKLTIEAEGSADESAITIMGSTPLSESTMLPVKLISYAARTGETIIFNGDKENQLLSNDEYLSIYRSKSLLCLPVSAKGKNIGVFYLENDMISGVFKGELLNLLQLMSSQIAISIENAKLYKNMETIIEQRTRELRERNIELKEANEAKTRFVANISHEIRTPLQGIIGITNLMKKSGKYNSGYTSMIQSSAEMLLQIINDILDISKIESNHINIEDKVFSIKQMLEQMVQIFKCQADIKGIDLIYSISSDIPEYIIGDSLRIKQILGNILGNAVKFTQEGKVVFTVVSDKTYDGLIDVKFTIEDTGIGIPEDKTVSIFESFTQVDNSISKKYGGTGLGLAIVKSLVEIMNGKIEVESVEGKGSAFICCLPLKIAVQEEIAAAVEDSNVNTCEKEDLPRLKVLAAEDNEINRIYIRNLLQYCNCDVTVVGNGSELLKLLEYNSYDCILMDKNMPELDGIETARIIRCQELNTGRHIPIIALTASAIAGDREMLLDMGMDYYLSKPIKEKDLLKILAEIGRNRESLESPGPGTAGADREEYEKYKLIDSVILREESELFGVDVMVTIINEFLKSFKHLMGVVEADFKAGDWSRLEKSAHKLSSAISSLYAEKPYKLAGDVERNARDKKVNEARENYNELNSIMPLFIKEALAIKEELQAGIQHSGPFQ